MADVRDSLADAVELGSQHGQRVRRACVADEFKHPATQAVVGFAVELGDQLFEVLRGVGSQQLESVFLPCGSRLHINYMACWNWFSTSSPVGRRKWSAARPPTRR
ncbi:hypothetical protein ACFFKH_27025 [Micromonospora marina]|uniref:hypothetical protein n=1 Tax=Micromonospora marina TaxID=307120 RepID=UPI001428B84B|nr:hypothetical protein [Micromonospora marina]